MPLWLSQQFPRAVGKKLSPLSHVVTVTPPQCDVRGLHYLCGVIPGGHPMGSRQGTCLPLHITGDVAFSSSKFRRSKEPWWGIQA